MTERHNRRTAQLRSRKRTKRVGRVARKTDRQAAQDTATRHIMIHQHVAAWACACGRGLIPVHGFGGFVMPGETLGEMPILP